MTSVLRALLAVLVGALALSAAPPALAATDQITWAVSPATDGAVEGTPYPLTWIPFFVAMAVGGLAIAFRAGERLRADTEGLV